MGRVWVEFAGELTGAHMFRRKDGRYVFSVQIETGQTLGEVLSALASEHDAIARAVFDPQTQRMRSSIVVVVNDRLAEVLDGLSTKLSEGDRILLLPILAGG